MAAIVRESGFQRKFPQSHVPACTKCHPGARMPTPGSVSMVPLMVAVAGEFRRTKCEVRIGSRARDGGGEPGQRAAAALHLGLAGFLSALARFAGVLIRWNDAQNQLPRWLDALRAHPDRLPRQVNPLRSCSDRIPRCPNLIRLCLNSLQRRVDRIQRGAGGSWGWKNFLHHGAKVLRARADESGVTINLNELTYA